MSKTPSGWLSPGLRCECSCHELEAIIHVVQCCVPDLKAGSSAVEPAVDNRVVAGSIPAPPTIFNDVWPEDFPVLNPPRL